MYANAVETTSQVMGLVKKRIGDIPLVAFSSNGFDEVFLEICETHGFYFIEGVDQKVKKEARDSGKRMNGTPYDSHPSSFAHRIYGREILEFLRDNQLIRMISSTKNNI